MRALAIGFFFHNVNRMYGLRGDCGGRQAV